MLKLLYIYILTLSIANALNWSLFKAGGSLGSPALRRRHKYLPPEQWFEQNLDHFNPIDNSTWKQVHFNILINEYVNI